MRLQEAEGIRFLHCDVFDWHQRTARAIGRDVDLLAELYGPLYAFTVAPHGGDYAKWRNFVCHYGFQFFGTVTHEGVRHSVYVRERCPS